MKKILALVLCGVILLSSSTPFLAEENKVSSSNKYDGLTYEYYQELSEIAEARGITLMPYDKMTANSISQSEKNNNENSSTNTVRGGATQSDAVSLSIPSYTLDSIDVAGEADWFKFQVNGNGAHNIYTVKDTDTKIELYKKTWYGSYVLIDSNDDISITDWNCRLEVGLETGVDYYIKITAYGKDTGEYALRLEENRDNMSCPTGGSWMWDVATPDPDGAFFNIDKITYLTTDEAQGYYIMVSDDSFRDVRDTILALTFDAAVTYIMGYYKIKEAIAAYIVSKAVGFGEPNLTKMELNSIAEAGGKDSNGNFKNGIKIVSVTTYSAIGAPVMLNTYETWSNGYMFGADRYRGTFDTTDKTPLWR